MKVELLFLISFSLGLISVGQCQLTIDTNGFVGCFTREWANYEFSVYVPYLSTGILTPTTCIKACAAMSYKQSAIVDGTMCFCKSTTTVISTPITTSSCQAVACSGDSTLACGAMNTLMVYNSQGIVTSSNVLQRTYTAPSNDNGSVLFSTISYFGNYNSTASQVRVYLAENSFYTSQNGPVSSFDSINSMKPLPTNISFVYMAVNSGDLDLEMTVSPTTISAALSSKNAIPKINVIDFLPSLAVDAFQCPSQWSTNEYLRCDLTLPYGNNLLVTIDYNDGNITTFKPQDFNTVGYGATVPQFFQSYVSPGLTTGSYLAVNTEVKRPSYLRAIELFAETPGQIDIKIVELNGCTPNNNLFASYEDFSTCATRLLDVYSYACAQYGGKFMKNQQTCSGIVSQNRYSSFLAAAPTISVNKTFSVNVAAGYNLLDAVSTLGLGPNYMIWPGQMLQVDFITSKVAVDQSGNGFSDFKFGSPFTKLNTPVNWRLFIRIIANERDKGISAFKMYSDPGIYNISLTIHTEKNGIMSVNQTLTQSVFIQNGIEGLNMTVDNNFSNQILGFNCIVNLPCNFTSVIQTGTNVSYIWTFTGTDGPLSVSRANLVWNVTHASTLQVFSQVGTFLVNLTATNSISRAFVLANITVYDALNGVSLYSGNSTQSASIVGQTAPFLFTIKSSDYYNCVLDFNDMSSLYTFSGWGSDLNNSIITHLYSIEKVYTLNLQCTNLQLGPFGRMSLNLTHYVQYVLTNLRLASSGCLVNTGYTVRFLIDSGSNPVIQFYFDGVIDSGISFANLIGTSSAHSAESSSATHNIIIQMSNYVSSLSLNATFEISSPIVSPTFSIVEPTYSGTTNMYEFLSSFLNLTLSINMASGSNVRISISVNNNSQAQLLFPGDWSAGILQGLVFNEPGDYQIDVNFWNALSSFTLSKSITIMSKVDNLLPTLVQNPVIFQKASQYGTAIFTFSYLGLSKAGSNATVTFWPGDSTNSTYGPFVLSMDFNMNKSLVEIAYNYYAVGSYSGVFLLQNSISSKAFSLTFQVVQTIDGFYIDVTPQTAAVPGSVLNITAYMLQSAASVQLTWFVDGVQVATAPRLSNSYLVGDSYLYTTSSTANKTYSIMVVASDGYTTQSRSYQIEMQNVIQFNSTVSQISANQKEFTFDVVLTSLNPTMPYYLIDYGDGSTVSLPILMPSNAITLNYTYQTSGYYNVKITVFNKVSTQTNYHSIEVSSDFDNFDCSLYWMKFPSAGTIEQAYSLTSGYYATRVENDIRFHCTWTSDAPATLFNIMFNNYQILYYPQTSSLDQVSQSVVINNQNLTRNGYVVILSSIFFIDGMNEPVKITVSNAKYWKVFNTNLVIKSSILNVQAWGLSLTTPIQTGATHTFMHSYSSLGEPSCAQIVLKSGTSYSNNLGVYGSSQQTCALYFPNQNYLGPYNTSSIYSGGQYIQVWSFTAIISRVGSITMNVNIRNYFDSITVSSELSVTSVSPNSCQLPLISIAQQSTLFYAPIQVVKQNEILVVSAQTTLNCSINLSNQKQWTVYLVDESTGTDLKQMTINSASNPTVNYNDLVIQPLTFSPGLYRFVYQVSLIDPQLQSAYQAAPVYTYVRIQSSGIVLNSLTGGIREIQIGIEQNLDLNPLLYSYFLNDSSQKPLLYKNMPQNSFQFFCQVIDDGVASYGYPQTAYNTNLDLSTMQTYQSTISAQQLSTNQTCFDLSSDLTKAYSFDTTGNVLTIKAGSLPYVSLRKYQFLVQTTYENVQYSQTVLVTVNQFDQLPISSLKCKFSDQCVQYTDYKRINPSNQLMLVGSCFSGCTSVYQVSYQFMVYKLWEFESTDTQEKWVPVLIDVNNTNSAYFYGANTNELTIYPSLFTSSPNVYKWKVDFHLSTYSYANGLAVGSSSIVLQTNRLPHSGSCSISPSSGISYSTWFTITCSSWTDDDGSITKYSYNAHYYDDQVEYGLGYNSNGVLTTQLPRGAPYDSDKLYIYVRIADNENGVTEYSITVPVVVSISSNSSYTQALNELLSADTQFTGTDTKSLYNGNTIKSIQDITVLSNLLNQQSTSDQKALIQSNGSYSSYFADGNGPIAALTGISASSGINETLYEANRNSRALARDMLASFVNNISISDVYSVKAQASMLSELTQQTDELTRNTVDSVTNQCIRLALALKNMTSTKSPLSPAASLDDVQSSITGILTTLGNMKMGENSYLNGRQKYLDVDFKRANELPTYYDTDLEYFWTNPLNFFGDSGSETSASQVSVNTNIQREKYQSVDTAQKTSSIVTLLGNILSSNLGVGQSKQITTPYLSLTTSRLHASSLSPYVNTNPGTIKLPSYCDLLNQPNVSSAPNLYYTPSDANNCTNKVVTMQTVSSPMPPSAFNGLNESRVGFSGSVSLSFYDENQNKIKITNSKTPIEFWIPRDESIDSTDYFQFVNALNITLSPYSTFIPFGLTISKVSNASLHIRIKPNNVNVGYLALLKFNATPVLNSSYTDYDSFRIFCPNPNNFLLTSSGEPFYLDFLNMNQVNNYQGFVGMGIRQLSSNETQEYCSANYSLKLTQAPLAQVNFTDNFWISAYTSGCYYLDEPTGKWSSYGTEIFADTNTSYTHCSTNHLTEFAGGFVVLPSQINFEYVWAHASFASNPAIYITIIVISGLYILLSCWAIIVDRRDKLRSGVTPLSDNKPGHKYYYEVMVYTGTRRDAGTDSKVHMVLYGDRAETDIRKLEDPERKTFRRGGIDSFIMAVKKPLGDLSFLRIWHDNSGKGNSASWFLKYIIVHDLQTRQIYYFLCQKWLGVEKDDGIIDRVLPVAGEKQKIEIAYLARKQAKQNLSDNHLWLSIFARPTQSSFSRFDRVTCCFVFLYITMLMSIMYYGLIPEGGSKAGFKIGFINITPEQIGVAIMTNLFTFPPCFILIQIFRRSRPRITRSYKLRRAIKLNIMQTTAERKMHILKTPKINPAEENWPENENQVKKEEYHENWLKSCSNVLCNSTFPWWFKFIAYMLSYAFIAVSIFFIIVKGIEFGNEKVEKWLTSIVMSFVTSVFLVQPLQVICLAVVFVLIFRKHDDKMDFEQDPDDKGQSFNDEHTKQNYQMRKLLIDKGSRLRRYMLHDHELEEARKKRLRELRMNRVLWEMTFYIIYFIILLMIVYGNNHPRAYDYQNNLWKVFIEPQSSQSFLEIERSEDIWNWATGTLAVGLRAGVLYNGSQPYGFAGFINDYSSRMLGFATIRQVRVQNNSCTIRNNFINQIDFCDADFSILNEDDAQYGYGWTEYNASYECPNGLTYVYDSFQYKTSDQLETLPYQGIYNLYMGGGYVYQLRGKLSYLIGNLTQLQSLDWIDRQTRALIIQFNLYNPNLNLLSVCTFIIEALPSGGYLPTAHIDILNLFGDMNEQLQLGLFVIYMVFIFFYMVHEILKLRSLGWREYVFQFWTVIEWLIIAIAWTTFAMFLYKRSATADLKKYFSETSGYLYISMQSMNQWIQLFDVFLAICIGLATVKALKFFRFNRRLIDITKGLRNSLRELIGFSFMFAIIWMSFVQVFYFVYGEKFAAYSTVYRTMETLFQVLLGKFAISALIESSPYMGTILFASFNIFLLFIVMNMFVTILTDSFETVRAESSQNPTSEDELLDYVWEKLSQLFSLNSNQPSVPANNPTNKTSEDYYEGIYQFPDKVDELIYYINLNTELDDDTNQNEPLMPEETGESKENKLENGFEKRKLFYKNKPKLENRI